VAVETTPSKYTRSACADQPTQVGSFPGKRSAASGLGAPWGAGFALFAAATSEDGVVGNLGHLWFNYLFSVVSAVAAFHLRCVLRGEILFSNLYRIIFSIIRFPANLSL